MCFFIYPVASVARRSPRSMCDVPERSEAAIFYSWCVSCEIASLVFFIPTISTLHALKTRGTQVIFHTIRYFYSLVNGCVPHAFHLVWSRLYMRGTYEYAYSKRHQNA